MKNTFSKLALAAVTVLLLGACNEINERIDKLESRIDGVENETIASINSQIGSINSSIADLSAIRTSIQTSIQNLTTTVEGQKSDLAALEAADEALGGRIDELTDFVNGELANYAKSDWVNATFSTLKQYEETCDTIAKIDARIGALDTKLSQDIANCKDTLTSWINAQFGSYYTIAEMDAMVGELKAMLDTAKAGTSGNIDSLAAELAATKAAIDTAKAQVTREYEAAIDTAITKLDGKLSKALQEKIDSVNTAIAALEDRVKTLELQVYILAGRINALEGMIQSVVIVPAYSDGSVEAKSGLLYLDIIVEPAEAVAGVTKNSLTVLVNKVKTKAVSVEEVAVADLKVDHANGILKARTNLSSKLPVTSGDALTIAVNVKNGLSDFTTEFYPVTLSNESNVTVTAASQSTDSTKITIAADTDFPKSVMGNIAVDEGFVVTHSTAIDMGGIGTITFDEDASAKIKVNADGVGSTSVFFKVEEVTESKPVAEANLVYEVTMKTVDEQGVEVFSKQNAEGVATVTVPLGDEVSSVSSVNLVSESGAIIEGGVVPESVHFENGILSFKVNHFSRYAIKYRLKEKVAQIGNKKFTTLEEAISAAQNGDTIELLCDCMEAEGIIVPGGKNFTLDFGGHTYEVVKDLAGSTGTKNQCFQLLKGSTLVFQNGTITTSCAKLGINSYSDLIVKDVTIDMSQTSATGQVACLETCNGNISLQGNTSLKAKEDQIAVLALYWPNVGYADIDVELNTTGEIKGLMAYGSYQVQDLSTVEQHSHVAIKNGKYDVTFDMDNLEKFDFKICGGIFKTSPDGMYLAPNYMVVSNTDSETSATYPFKVQQKPYVAQIGDTKYFTLAEAVAAVPANTQTTITMVNDFATTEKVTIAATQNIVLDLNGKKVSYTTSGTGSFIKNTGKLKVKDSGANGIITAEFSNPGWNAGCYTIDNFGASTASILVIESGTIENTSPAGLAWPINNGSWGTSADLVINGGTIHSVNYVPVREYLQYGGKKTIVINGGKFISDNSRAIAVQLSDATVADQGSYVEINGGEFSCNGSGILYVDLHAANLNTTGFTMTVNGGQFKNANADAPVLVYDDEENTQTSAVLLSKILKGGIYSKEPAQELVAFGYYIEANTDSQTSSAYPWRVAANSAEGAEVSISKPGQTTVYSTLAAFRDATNAGNTFAGYTVTLLKDIDLTNDDWVPIGTTDYYNYFSGVFDGSNHKITLKKNEIGGDFGLFNLLVGDSEDTPAVVKNLNLDANLSAKSNTRTWIGGITNLAYGYVLFENIVVTGSIVSGGYAGGIVGFSSQNDGDWGSKVIYKNCINKANITINGKGDWTCLGGIAAQTGANLDSFINCRNEGILTSDHTNIPNASSYIGHMVGKGTYGKDISISECSFSESATITGWNKKEGDYQTYPFEGKIAGTEDNTYGSGTPNLGKQMVGGYFKSCSLDGVIKNNIYPNGNGEK